MSQAQHSFLTRKTHDMSMAPADVIGKSGNRQSGMATQQGPQ